MPSIVRVRKTRGEVRVANEVWIATALLHREHPECTGFTVREIRDRAEQEGIEKPLRPGVYQHAYHHCVANRPRETGKYRMLFATGSLTRRLFKNGDPYDRDREGGKTAPSKSEVPERYHVLIDWYHSQYAHERPDQLTEDPLLVLQGSGRELWADEHADEYVRRLREGWE